MSGDEVRIVASSSERHGSVFEPRTFAIGTRRGFGVTSHIADLLRRGEWPAEHPAATDGERYFDGRTVRLDRHQLRENPFAKGDAMPHLKDGTRAIMAVPVRERKSGRFLGFLKIHNVIVDGKQTEQVFSDSQAAVAHAFASVVASLWSTDGHEGADKAELLRRVSRRLHPAFLTRLTDLEPEPAIRRLIQKIVELAIETSGADGGAARIVPPPPRSLRGTVAIPGWPIVPVAHQAGAETLESDAAESRILAQCELERIRMTRRNRGAEKLMAQTDWTEFAAVPIPKLHGAMCLLFREGQSPERLEFVQETMSILSETLRPAIAHLRMVWTLRQEKEELRGTQSPFAIPGMESGEADPEAADRMFDSWLEGTCTAFGWDHGLLFLPDFGHRVLRVRAGYGHRGEVRGFSYTVEDEHALVVRCWNGNDHRFSADPNLEASLHPRGLTEFRIQHSCLAIPIRAMTGSGEAVGDAAAAFSQHRLQLALYERLGEISRRVRNSKGRKEILLGLMDVLRTAGFARVRHFRYDPLKREFEAEESLGMTDPEAFLQCRSRLEDNSYARDTVERIQRRGRAEMDPIYYDPATSGLGDDPNADALQKPRNLPWMVLPLTAMGRLVGMFTADMGTSGKPLPRKLNPLFRLLAELADLVLSTEAAQQMGLAAGAFAQLTAKMARNAQAVSALWELAAAEAPAEEAPQLPHLLELERWRQIRFTAVLRQWATVQESHERREPVSLAALVRRTTGTLEPFAKFIGVSLEMRFDPALVAETMADPSTIEIAVENLVHNAIAFSPPAHAVEIGIVRVTEDEGVPGWNLVIRDEGPGVPEDQRTEAIFRPFLSIPRAAGPVAVEKVRYCDVEHTGLGLYLSRIVAHRLGGDIYCRRRLDGRGSEFTLFLPVQR